MITTGKYPNLRLRRNRKNDWIRRLTKENTLSVDDLVQPIFIIEGKNKKIPIKSMPGVFRYSLDKVNHLVKDLIKIGIPMIAIFPYVEKKYKNIHGSEALNENNLVCRATRTIKKKFKDKIGIMCDVALDPYTSHGHDGIIKSDQIDNDLTLKILSKQAVIQARAGCDVIAPSDMMDGRIAIIRKALDENNFNSVRILSYAVKYASSYYGPFRDAVGSKKLLKGDKKTYQMDYSNSDEALREVSMDIKEGADIILIKPGMPYLDILSLVKKTFNFPTFSYQVSGEYLMINKSIESGFMKKEEIIIETLSCFKRAGADAILTYFAMDAAKILSKS